MPIPLIRETMTWPDIDRQFSDFTGTRRVINIWPWLNYPFSLLLIAASQASDTLSAAAAPSHQHTTPVLCQHNYLRGWTANWFGWKTTWKQNSVPKRNLLQSCTNSCAGTKEKTVRGWEQAALGMGRSSWHHCPQGHGLSSQDAAPVWGTDSVLIWKSEMVLAAKLLYLHYTTNQKDGACIWGETWTFSHLILSFVPFFI